jgi:hypothetical protein
MGAGRWDEGYQAFDEFASFHQDVSGAIAPTALQAKRERSIGAFFESLAREWGSRDVATQPLEPPPVPCRHGHVGVQAHAPVLGDARRTFRVRIGRLAFARFDPIAEPAPPFAAMRSRGNAGSQRGGSQ